MKANPKKRIKSVSTKRAKELGEYRKLSRAFLKGCQCAVFPWMPAVEVHHLRGRSGKLLCDVRYWLGVSRIAHKQIHLQPEWARRNGYLCARGQWGKA